jgi:hypothetical protein
MAENVKRCAASSDTIARHETEDEASGFDGSEDRAHDQRAAEACLGCSRE